MSLFPRSNAGPALKGLASEDYAVGLIKMKHPDFDSFREDKKDEIRLAVRESVQKKGAEFAILADRKYSMQTVRGRPEGWDYGGLTAVPGSARTTRNSQQRVGRAVQVTGMSSLRRKHKAHRKNGKRRKKRSAKNVKKGEVEGSRGMGIV
ncbi:unnamed protein product [Amoebophrya sp. A25]|nr:unnamed protein product [Amoebophrya sp. A25]|eukprot:GSA25T00006895001.1